ncbi:hypothetical protein [Chlorobium ferrooxidans]|uniref:hypothetical protein n=1 Tax=Chlorobium ferrooxidans TaxID=84205 RepID=UPI00058C296C|nr:hypothetical protein [Chlorobium ferrooxidans]
MSEVLLGIVAGIITSMIIGAVTRFFYDTILPWYQQKVYKGVILQGTWDGEMAISGITYSMSLCINQKGHKISGSLIANTEDKNAPKKHTNMQFLGEINDGYAMINCISTDRTDISFGTMILKIGNRIMTGKQLFRDLSESKVDVFQSKVRFTYA